MEVDFDKEIDTLLRKAQRDAPVLVGDFASSRHLDADEISAFAENAMPENSRALYTAHLADCDRCRKILSNLLMMNAEAAPAAASPSVITIAERSAPWYRKLFLFPNLAYVMGGLVLVFGGFLAFAIVRSSLTGDSSSVSQITETESTKGGPNFQTEPAFSGDTSAAANMTSNSAANANSPVMTNSNMSSGDFRIEKGPNGGGGGGRTDGNSYVLDGASSADVTSAPLAPPPSAAGATQPALPKDVREQDDLKAKTEDKVTDVTTQEAEKSSSNLSLMRKEKLPSTSAQSGPMRNNENQYNRQLENLERRSAAKKSASDEESSSGRRVVSGKTFERKQGVWYDTTYQGRPTINVRRGSDEYNRLDGGLRSIANSLGGTAVIVWGAKAYRIQ
ncbi:MAG: zf-HC2 domain-containing protein [Acidobacteriota bacterium]